MRLKLGLALLLFFRTTLLWAMPTDSTLVETNDEDELSMSRYSDNATYWGFSVGYFPILEEDFESGGISTTLYSDNRISKIFKLGWSIQLNIAINGGGYMALYGYLSYPLKLGKNNLYI